MASIPNDVSEWRYVPARHRYRTTERNLIVEPVKAPRPLGESGLILPDNTDRQKVHKYTSPLVLVLAAGPDCKVVKAGDVCVVPIRIAQQAVEINFEGDEVHVIDETNVASVVDPAQAAEILTEARRLAARKD